MYVSGCMFLVAVMFRGCSGHGYLFEPPSRASMWRTQEFKDQPKNHDDMGMNCGGSYYQHHSQGGKCGLCGDRYGGTRKHEAGGQYANGVITRSYQPGDVMTVQIQVTASHKGYFEFKMCPHDDVTTPATEECINQHVLKLPNGDDKFYYDNTNGLHTVEVQLPNDVTCEQCVFVWIWTTGNNWGTCPNGQGALGCGPQETFRGCADISIQNNGHMPVTASTGTILTEKSTYPPLNPTPTPQTNKPTNSSNIPNSMLPGALKNLSAEVKSIALSMKEVVNALDRVSGAMETILSAVDRISEIVEVLANEQAPSTPMSTPVTYTSTSTSSTRGTTTTTTRASTTTTQPPGGQCKAVGDWANTPGMDAWCENNCNHNPSYCPSSHCKCG